jgi:hypothetical protein
MRRVLVFALVIVTGVTFLAPPASGRPRVTRERFSGESAFAFWFDEETGTSAFIGVDSDEFELSFATFEPHFDAAGNFIGATEIGNNTNLHGFTIDGRRLTSATLSGTFPASRCEFDEVLELIGCTSITVAIDVTWTGQGSITRSAEMIRRVGEGFVFFLRQRGVFRDAVASGSIGDVQLAVADLEQASLAFDAFSRLIICREGAADPSCNQRPD